MNYIGNIEEETLQNENFRKVLHTTKLSQLVVMSLKPGEDVGMETHDTHDQFIRVEKGEGTVTLDGKISDIQDDFAVVIGAGTEHNITNTGKTDLKFYTIYTPPEHKEGTIHTTKKEALEDEHDHYQ